MAFVYKGSGDFITVTVATGKSATAGYLAEMTDDYTARNNETKPCETALGYFVTAATAGNVVGVMTSGIIEVTAAAANITAGKTVIGGNGTGEENMIEDGNTAGFIIGRALETVTSGAAGDILVGHC